MVSNPGMNNARLEALLSTRLPALEGTDGVWRADVDDLLLYVFTDEHHDRMRIMIPIGEVNLDDTALLRTLLSANFDRALDAKYALNDGVLWSTFLHRLSWLSEASLDAALEQVITLARNTGSTFASSELVFASPGERDAIDES